MSNNEKPWKPNERVRIDPDTWQIHVNPALIKNLSDKMLARRYDESMEALNNNDNQKE